MSDQGAYERDRGLAAERTELAWGRNALALMACGAAVARGLPGAAAEGQPLVGVVVLLLGGLVWLAGVPYARRRAASGRVGPRPVARSHELAPLAYGTALVGVAALVIGTFF